MTALGRVESLWRYPVKSMAGEELAQAHLGFAGVYGDRRYAFVSSAAPDDFPYLTARDKHEMLLHRAVYRCPESMLKPSARRTGAYDAVEVETPAGEKLAIDDPRLIDRLREGLRDRHRLTLAHSAAALTDSRPISLISLQTVDQLSHEIEITLDKRRFRANVFIDLGIESGGFHEDEWVGQKLRIGSKVIIEILNRNQRCKMVTLDPDSAQPAPGVMKTIARDHQSRAGIYAAVLAEGVVMPGDEIWPIEA